MAAIRRCHECRRWYLPSWGSAIVRFRDEHGHQIGKPAHGHPRCMLRIVGPTKPPKPETVPHLTGDALERRLRRIEQIVATTDSGESPFGWRTGR